MTAKRNRSSHRDLKPGALAVAYSGAKLSAPGCVQQPSADIIPLRTFDIEPVAGLELEDLRGMKVEELRRLVMRASMVIEEKVSGTRGPHGQYSRLMVEVLPGHRVPAPVAAIIRQAAREARITTKELLDRTRNPDFARPRQRAMASCRAVTLTNGQRAYSFPDIGRWFRRDHSTVVHAWKLIPPEDRIVL